MREGSTFMDTKVNRKVKCLETLIANIGTKDFPLQKIILFGSFATKQFNERSDLDLCLVHEADKEPACREKVEIEAYIDNFVGDEMDVDFLYTTLNKLEEGNQVFESIRKEGLVLWEHSGI